MRISTHIPLATLALALVLIPGLGFTHVCEAVPLYGGRAKGTGTLKRRYPHPAHYHHHQQHLHHRDLPVPVHERAGDGESAGATAGAASHLAKRSPVPTPQPLPLDLIPGRKTWLIGFDPGHHSRRGAEVAAAAEERDDDESGVDAFEVERGLDTQHDHFEERRTTVATTATDPAQTMEKRNPAPFDFRPGVSNWLIGYDPGHPHHHHHHRRGEGEGQGEVAAERREGVVAGLQATEPHMRQEIKVQQRSTSTSTTVDKRFDLRPGHPGKSDNSKMDHRSVDVESTPDGATLESRSPRPSPSPSPFDWTPGHANWLIGFDPGHTGHHHHHHRRLDADAPLQEISIQEKKKKRGAQNGGTHLGDGPSFDEPFHPRAGQQQEPQHQDKRAVQDQSSAESVGSSE